MDDRRGAPNSPVTYVTGDTLLLARLGRLVAWPLHQQPASQTP